MVSTEIIRKLVGYLKNPVEGDMVCLLAGLYSRPTRRANGVRGGAAFVDSGGRYCGDKQCEISV